MTTRISKIARFPAEIRELLNERLYNGELGRTILKWLNNLPEAKDVLTDLFEGKPVTHQNLSEWRRGGYQDWLFQQQRLEWFHRLGEEDAETIAHNFSRDAHEAMGRFFIFEIGQALAAMQKIKNPDDRWARLQNLTREFSRLQNAYNWSRRVALEWDKYNDNRKPAVPTEPEPQLEEQEETPELLLDAHGTPDNGDSARTGRSESRPRDSHPGTEPSESSKSSAPITISEPERQRAGALPDAPRNSEPEDQRASVPDCDSPPPLFKPEPQHPIAFQPIPTPSPTTTHLLLSHPQADNLSPRPSKPLTSPPPGGLTPVDSGLSVSGTASIMNA